MLLQRVLIAIALMLPCGSGWGFVFTRVADTSTAIPGGSGSFTGFDPELTIGGGPASVAFRGFGAGGQQGIYFGSGAQITRMADRATAVPGTSDTFDTFGSPSGSQPILVQASGAGRTGIYSITTSGAVDTIDDAPVGSTEFGRAAAALSQVAYLRNGVVISNLTGTLAPVSFAMGNVVVQSLGDPDIAQFSASNGASLGVRANYTQSGVPHTGVFTKTVGSNDEILFPTSTLQTGEASVNWSGAVAVNEGGTAVRFRPFAIFGQQQIVVGDPIPGGAGGFTGFLGVSAGSPTLGFPSNDVVFVGLGTGGQEGIYVRGLVGSGFGPLNKVIARGDVLDGRTVAGLTLGRDAEYQWRVAFLATFTDGSSGIYWTPLIPEPAVGAIAIGAAILCGRCPRRRRV